MNLGNLGGGMFRGQSGVFFSDLWVVLGSSRGRLVFQSIKNYSVTLVGSCIRDCKIRKTHHQQIMFLFRFKNVEFQPNFTLGGNFDVPHAVNIVRVGVGIIRGGYVTHRFPFKFATTVFWKIKENHLELKPFDAD